MKNLLLTPFVVLLIITACNKGQIGGVTNTITQPISKVYYSKNFEDGDIKSAEMGTTKIELMGANSQCIVADNPSRTGFNTSAKVFKSMAGFVDATQSNRSRAELSTQRIVTDEKVLTYKFEVYLPADYFTGITSEWQYTAQFKTYPCQKADGTYQICDPAGGIFNDITFDARAFNFKCRALPDCHEAKLDIDFEKWMDLRMEIYWTKSTKGWVRLYKNDVLVYSKTGMRTLFTDWTDGTSNTKNCNIYWSIGQYTRWFPNGTTRTHRVAYYDNIEIKEGS